jgi:hypothetical protein
MEYQLDKKLELSEKSARESADELFKLAQAVSSDATAIRQKAESDAKSRRKALDSQMSELSAADKSGAASKVTDSLTASLSAASTLLGRPAGIEASSTLESESLGHAAYVRVGRVQINGHSEVDVPALVPLLNHGNLIVRSDADSTDAAHELIHQLTFRALTQTFPGQLELQVFDPKLSGSFSDFRKLREQSLFPEPGDSSADLAELLDATSDRVARITENLGRTRDLGDLRAISGQPIEHYTLLVLLDFPTNASQESLSLLERIVDRGPRAGISTIIHHDLGARGASDIDLSGLTGRGWVIDLTGKRPSVERYPNDAVVLDPPPDGDLVLESVNAIAATAKTGAAPKVLFSELIPTNATPAESSSDGVTATFAKKGLEPVSIRLGDESEQRHHVLVAGASGQG